MLMLFNPRGLVPKQALVKRTMRREGVTMAGFPESQTYQETCLDDEDWHWEAGKENTPAWHDRFPPRGMGALTSREKTKSSLVHKGTHSMWIRMEGREGRPIFVCVAYYPKSTDVKGHREANKEVLQKALEYGRAGDVIFMGDCNAHTQSNGDTTPIDTAGRLLQEMFAEAGLLMVNGIDSLCVGTLTRVEVKSNGTARTNIRLCGGVRRPTPVHC